MSFTSIPGEFFIFAATLIAIGLFHGHTLLAAASGLLTVLAYKLAVLGGSAWLHWAGGVAAHEWSTLANIVLVLLGFAVMANHFEHSQLAEALPRVLPDNWTGGLLLLGLLFVLSIFLDNIAAAIIGGIMARHYSVAKSESDSSGLRQPPRAHMRIIGRAPLWCLCCSAPSSPSILSATPCRRPSTRQDRGSVSVFGLR